MFFENELPINHEPSLDYMAKEWATENVEEAKEEEAIGFFDSQFSTCFDYEYEMAWSALESELEFEGLKMTTEWWDRGRT